MDNYGHQQVGGGSEKHTPIDDASMHTITSSSLQQSADPTYDRRPQTSYSDTGFTRPYTSQSADNTPEHYKSFSPSPNPDVQSQNGAGLSRPPSGLSQGQSAYGNQAQSEAAQRQQAQKNASVVIKVGMVGDAQIGKTSLMVKYVEGSWDEDYIQTLGTPILAALEKQRRSWG